MNSVSKIKLHSFHIIVILALTLILGSLGIGLFVQYNPFIRMFDDNLYQQVHYSYRSSWFELLIIPFNYNFLPIELSPGRMPSYYYLMFLFTLIYLFIFKRSLVLWGVFCFIVGTLIAQAVTTLDWQLAFRERPFHFLPNTVDEIGRAAWGKLSSYPSGHARETALYSTIIVYFIPNLKWAAIIFVLFIAYSRVYIGAHYPTDVLSGILIGYLSAKVTLTVAKELQLIITRRKEMSPHNKIKQSKEDVHYQ